MFRNRTVFIIGAGAGHDIGMPLGLDLAKDIMGRIANPMSSDRTRIGITDRHLELSFKALAKQSQVDENAYLSACATMRKGLLLSPSIDEYLYAHQEDKPLQILGKVAIARTIAYREQNSPLYFGRDEDTISLNRLSDSWLLPFFRLIQRRIQRGDEMEIFKGFSIVNFNYDRCLEHYLFHAIRDYFNVDDTRAAEVMESLSVFHPYGSIGDLEWQNKKQHMVFGAEVDGRQCAVAAARLRTFTEEIAEPDALSRIRTALSDAEYIIFVGFHFHLQNLRLLCPQNNRLNAQRLFGTVLGRSTEDVHVIRRRLASFVRSSMNPNSVNLLNLDCRTTFQQYALTWGNFVDPNG